MSSPDDTKIPSLVASSFKTATTAGQVTLYEFDSVTTIDDDPFVPPLKHFVHVAPDLVDKPGVPLKTPDLSKAGKKDPFEGPEYGPGEHVLDLEQDGGKYSIVHNLHALFPEHAMAIPHFGKNGTFRPQTSNLILEDLAVAWRIVDAYDKAGREVALFFNGGPLAGASQPHLHLQFTPFQHDVPPACEALARSLPFPPPSPSTTSLLDPTALASVGASSAARLPLPWVHFYLPVPPRPSASSSSAPSAEEEEAAFHEALFKTYETLLHTSHSYLSSSVPPSALPPVGPKRDSYNLFLTSRHMHLIPRTDRLVRIPRNASRGQGPTGGEGEDEMRLSVNGLLFLGYFFVGSEEEKRDLLSHGLERTLREAGYANEEWDGEKKGEREGV